MENEFLRKRLQQCEERLDSELTARKELEQKVRCGAGPQKCQRVGRSSPPLWVIEVLADPGEGGRGYQPLQVFPSPLLLQMLVTGRHEKYCLYMWIFYPETALWCKEHGY